MSIGSDGVPPVTIGCRSGRRSKAGPNPTLSILPGRGPRGTTRIDASRKPDVACYSGRLTLAVVAGPVDIETKQGELHAQGFVRIDRTAPARNLLRSETPRAMQHRSTMCRVVTPVNARPVQRRTPDLPGCVIVGRTPPTRWEVPAAGRARGALGRGRRQTSLNWRALRRKGVWRGWVWSSVCCPCLQSPLIVRAVDGIAVGREVQVEDGKLAGTGLLQLAWRGVGGDAVPQEVDRAVAEGEVGPARVQAGPGEAGAARAVSPGQQGLRRQRAC